MQKTRKKNKNKMIKSLTEACEHAKVEIPGFKWFSYEFEDKFPDDLVITCGFESKEVIEEYESNGEMVRLGQLLNKSLNDYGVKVKDIRNHLKIQVA